MDTLLSPNSESASFEGQLLFRSATRLSQFLQLGPPNAPFPFEIKDIQQMDPCLPYNSLRTVTAGFFFLRNNQITFKHK